MATLLHAGHWLYVIIPVILKGHKEREKAVKNTIATLSLFSIK